MSSEEKCPRCESDRQSASKAQAGGTLFSCGTIIAANGNIRYASHRCAELERVMWQMKAGALTAQLAAETKRADFHGDRVDLCETIIACAVDHMNTQAREWQVDECKMPWSDPYSLRALAERLWLRSMKREDKLRDRIEAAEDEVKRLREGIEHELQGLIDDYTHTVEKDLMQNDTGQETLGLVLMDLTKTKAALLAQPSDGKEAPHAQ